MRIEVERRCYRPVAGSHLRHPRMADEGFAKNVVAYRCITEIAKSAACVPWVLFQRRRGDKVQLNEHPLLDLLDRPNPLQARSEYLEAVIAFLQISGNSYLEAVMVGEAPAELWTLRPDRMKVLPSNTGLPSGYVYEVGGRKRTWPADPQTGRSPILHLRSFHPLNDWYGLSPLEAAARSIDQRNASDAWNLSLVQNSGRPSGALMVDMGENVSGTLTDEQFSRLKQQVEMYYAGAANAGRPLVLEGGLKWQAMSLSPTDMDFLETKHTSSRDIALAFGVPPQLLGIPGDSTFANYEQARLAFWEECLFPLLRHLRDELNGWLCPMFSDDLELEVDLDQVPALTPRRKEKWDMTLAAVREGVISRNEAREELGLGERPGADELLVPATLLPLGFELSPEDMGEEALERGIAEVKATFGDISYKLLTDSSQSARGREQRLQVRLQVAFERSLAIGMAREFRGAAHAAAEAFRGSGVQGVDIALADHPGTVERLLRGHYQKVMETFGRRILDAAKSAGMGIETKDADDVFHSAVLRWIEAFTGRKVQGITETTRTTIADIIAEGELEDLSHSKIAKLIEEKAGGIFSKVRAARIARTETHTAAVAGGDEAVRALGVADDVLREWIASDDDRTRASHRAADGQRRKMDEPFEVGDVKLIAPGDPAGPPAETVNCRCVIGYVTTDL